MERGEDLPFDILDKIAVALVIETLEGAPLYRNRAARNLEADLGVASEGNRASEAWQDARRNALHTHSAESFELRYGLNGRPRIHRGKVEVVNGWLLTQIEDHSLAGEAIQELRAFIDTSPQLPWTSDATGHILDAGPRWEDWTGLRIAEGLGSGWLDAVHPDDRHWVADSWADHTARRMAIDIEYRLRDASGTYRWVRARATPREGPSGAIERWYGTLEDVDDRRGATAALEESEQRFRAIADHAPVVIWVVDAEGSNTYHSRLWTELTGQSSEDARGEGWLAQVHPEDRPRVAAVHERAYAARGAIELEYRLRRADGSWAWVIDLGHPRFTPAGDFVGYVGSVVDITDRRAAEEDRLAAQRQMLHMARHDILTGLPNRAQFAERMEELQGALADGDAVAVLILDLDGFKAINDGFGHPAGDAILKQVAERLRTHVREIDLVARFGGDEFAFIVHPLSRADDVRHLGKRLIDAFELPIRLGERHMAVRASVGIAVSPEGGRTGDELVTAADIALYEAKRGGRSTFRVFDPDLDIALKTRQSLKAALLTAVEEHQFLLHYQPVISLQDGRTVGYEALLRWMHPERGLVGPAEFIELAEETGLIVPIGGWVIRQALGCLKAGRMGDASVSVNLSPAQFTDRSILETVSDALAQTGVAPERLQLEITESVLLDASEYNLSVLRDLRAMGVGTVLDDFGTGYSSLGYLRSFLFDKIKLDRSFIKDLPKDEQALAIVNAVAGLGQALSIGTTAEGVETEEQLAIVKRAGFGEVQGFLIGRPAPLP